MKEKVPNPFGKLSIHKLGGPAQSFVFFVLFYLYLWLVVDLRLIYHGGGMITNFPVFYRGWTFFRPFLSYPGGPVEYVCAFLSQLLYIGWAGAIVVTAQAWLICLCTGYILKAIGASALRLLRFVPPVLVLITYTQYTYHFVTTTALLTSLLFVCLYIRIAQKSKPFCLVTFLVLSVILYYIAGGAYLLFAILCAIFELFFASRWQVALAYLLSAIAIPYIEGVLILGTSLSDAFNNLLPVSWKVFHHGILRTTAATLYSLYLFTPLAAIGLKLWRLFAGSSVEEKQQVESASPRGEKPFWRTGRPALRWLIGSCLLFALATVAVLSFYDRKQKTLFQVDYYACHRMWPQVLAASRHHPYDYFVVYAANRALYHTGRLPYDMFSYYQNPDTLLLTAKEHSRAYWRKFDTYIDLGRINMAEHLLTESMETFGPRPILLKRLAVVNMVKGNVGAARIYLNALGKTLFYQDWANDYLCRLRSDAGLATEQYVQHLRSLMVEADYDFSLLKLNILSDMLEKNRQNRMAFEYLMALYLLTKQLDKFVLNLECLSDFGYTEIPELYEEAILLYEAHTKKSVDLKGGRISAQTHQRTHNFSDILSTFYGSDRRAATLSGTNKVTAFNDLAKKYGDTYLFYYFFGLSGMAE